LIQEKLGHEKPWQNLIFSGTMLDSSRTIASYKITEKDFLVLLVKKPKEAAPEPPKDTPTAPVETKAPVQQPQPTSQPTQPTQPAQPTQPTQPTPSAQPGGGEEHEQVIRRIMEMGFDRTQVERALQASFLNADRAVEYLMTGAIPDIGTQGDAEMDEGDEQPDARQLFEMLRNSPHFNNLRMLARTNPEMLEQVLTQLPPEILNVITNNQEEFIRLLSEDPTPAGAAPGGGAGRGAPQGPQAGQGVAIPQQQRVQVNLSPEDQSVITNLVDMGFDKNKVMEAYLLFEKDADMTANYLLNHGWDDAPNAGQ